LEIETQCDITEDSKLVSRRAVRTHEEILQSVNDYRRSFKELATSFSPSYVWNSDQTGFNMEIISNRTLSTKGEKRTYEIVNSPKNKVTHSYTVQYIISMDGDIIGDAFICFQVYFDY